MRFRALAGTEIVAAVGGACAGVAFAARGTGVIALAQFSMARAQAQVASATGLRVLTTVDSSVAMLKRRLGAS